MTLPTAHSYIFETPSLLSYLTDAPTVLYANPYNLDATGFYFTDAEEFIEKAAKLKDSFGLPVEEFEIDYIDGNDAELFAACNIGQCDLDLWQEITGLDECQKPSLFYCVDIIGVTAREALEKVAGSYTFEDYSVSQGTVREYANEYIESTGMLDSMPESLRYYFDVDSFARDMEMNGDIYEFEYNGETYTVSQ